MVGEPREGLGRRPPHCMPRLVTYEMVADDENDDMAMLIMVAAAAMNT
jgi:hypothetical protein